MGTTTLTKARAAAGATVASNMNGNGAAHHELALAPSLESKKSVLLKELSEIEERRAVILEQLKGIEVVERLMELEGPVTAAPLELVSSTRKTLTTAEVAALLGKSPGTVRNDRVRQTKIWKKGGTHLVTPKWHKIGNGDPFYLREDVEEFLKLCRQQGPLKT